MTVSCPPQPPAAPSLEQVLQHAVSHHQAGRIQEAEDLYRTILQAQPTQPDANHNMGVLAVQRGQPAVALPYFEAALAARPEQPHRWLSYIETLIQAGQAEVARQVLALGRQHGLEGAAVEALAGQLTALAQTIPSAAAVPQGRAETSTPPSGKKTEKSRTAKAKKTAGTAASNKQDGKAPSPQEINTLMALHGQGQFAEAARLARSLTLRFPRHGFGWKVLGHVLQLQGLLEEALAAMRKAVELLPGDPVVHNIQGNILLGLGRRSSAEVSYRRALKIKPGFAEAHSNLGIVLRELGQLDGAAASCCRALEISPDFVEAHSNLGNTLRDLGQFDDAVASYHRALEINPGYAEGHNNLGSILQYRGQFEAAVASFRRALEIRPDFDGIHSNLLFCLSHIEDVGSEELFAEHLRFGEQFEAPLRSLWSRHGNTPDPTRCLHVGFVSGDLRNHAVASAIEPVLANLAGYGNLSLHGYYNHTTEDKFTKRMCKYFTYWNTVTGMSDAALAEKIRADGIDILIDLSGHTAKNRLLTFARKPAPVQATWIGYPGTTGLRAMDYFLADRFILTPGQFDGQFTEKIGSLLASAPFLPAENAPSLIPLPALSKGYVTFGSFNQPRKLSKSVIALWSQLLRALPDSRMLLGAMPEDGKYGALPEWFAREGIAPERLSFHPRCGMDGYLNLHQQVDICLDTFPYTGGTTTLHALWMGVPTLTLAGRTVPGRVSAAILTHVGLEAYIAQNVTEFVQKGVSAVGNLSSLASLRAEMRDRISQSAMGRPAMVAAGIERAFRIMWQRWCAGLPPESFEVHPQDLDNAMQEAAK